MLMHFVDTPLGRAPMSRPGDHRWRGSIFDCPWSLSQCAARARRPRISPRGGPPPAVGRRAPPPADFTEAERALLAAYAIGAVPANPANRFADDAGAAAIGQQFFFDTRFSGPLAVGGDGARGAPGPRGASGTVPCPSCHDPARGGADV